MKKFLLDGVPFLTLIICLYFLIKLATKNAIEDVFENVIEMRDAAGLECPHNEE